MEIIDAMSYDQMSRHAASILGPTLSLEPQINFALAWGSSPIGCYQCLREWCLDWGKARVFAVDEYDHPTRIGEDLLERSLFHHINLPAESKFNPIDYTDESRYDRLIESHGGIRLMLLGMGRNGHIAACEPATSFLLGTHATELAESTIADNQAKYGERMTRAYTIGPKTIMASTEIILLVSGEQKRQAANAALYGPVTEDVPASVLQRHSKVTVLCDFAL